MGWIRIVRRRAPWWEVGGDVDDEVTLRWIAREPASGGGVVTPRWVIRVDFQEPVAHNLTFGDERRRY